MTLQIVELLRAMQNCLYQERVNVNLVRHFMLIHQVICTTRNSALNQYGFTRTATERTLCGFAIGRSLYAHHSVIFWRNFGLWKSSIFVQVILFIWKNQLDHSCKKLIIKKIIEPLFAWNAGVQSIWLQSLQWAFIWRSFLWLHFHTARYVRICRFSLNYFLCESWTGLVSSISSNRLVLHIETNFGKRYIFMIDQACLFQLSLLYLHFSVSSLSSRSNPPHLSSVSWTDLFILFHLGTSAEMFCSNDPFFWASSR